jgi:hypothetical protein
MHAAPSITTQADRWVGEQAGRWARSSHPYRVTRGLSALWFFRNCRTACVNESTRFFLSSSSFCDGADDTAWEKRTRINEEPSWTGKQETTRVEGTHLG